MKVVFMGTPEYAARALRAIVEAGHRVLAVVTQPDRPKGRGGKTQETPVKQCAVRYGIPVYAPPRVKEPEAVSRLGGYGADIFVVAAYGQILSQEILRLPPLGCVNIHASLLPKYRGAAPIQRAILAGEEETGVTIMQMDAGIDTGDILGFAAEPILDTDTAQSLGERLADVGAKLIVRTLPLIEAGLIEPIAQDEQKSSYAKMLTKQEGRIDWTLPARLIERQVRAMNPWPGAYTSYRGKTLKIWGSVDAGIVRNGPVGSVANIDRRLIYVNTGSGQLGIARLQPEGKKQMDAKDFLLGYPLALGETLGEAGAGSVS